MYLVFNEIASLCEPFASAPAGIIETVHDLSDDENYMEFMLGKGGSGPTHKTAGDKGKHNFPPLTKRVGYRRLANGLLIPPPDAHQPHT